MTDPNYLSLFGAVLGVIGSLLLGVDALGAPEFLSALKSQDAIVSRMTHTGFLALINNIFVYAALTLTAFALVFYFSGYSLVASLLIAPFVYLVYKGLGYLLGRLVRFINAIGPKYDFKKHSIPVSLMMLVPFGIHFLVWGIVYVLAYLLYLIVQFGLDLPLRVMSEAAAVPATKLLYSRVAKVVADEHKWRFKRSAFIGSLLVMMGFAYQFVGTLFLAKWQ